MEFINNSLPAVINPVIIMDEPAEETNSAIQFIEANTLSIKHDELINHHIIPVFVKDNEPVISQNDFIQTMQDTALEIFEGERILKPVIRVSHPIKGRIPEARNKPANELIDNEKTLYYERMAFTIEIPSIADTIGGNELSLTIGGVKSHASDNLYNKKGSDEHFKIFIGFQNKVCTNMCIWTDGLQSELRVQNIGQLKGAIHTLLQSYNSGYQLFHLKQLAQYYITEQQFALVIGRCRLYQHLEATVKKDIPVLKFGDNQINAICKDYFRDKSFCKDANGNINLWKLYNLFTGSNKSSYIDNFLEKSVNAYNFIEQIKRGLEGKQESWYLN